MERIQAFDSFVTHKGKVPKADTDAGTIFSGYASVFGVLVDAHIPTVILPGAFARTIVSNRHRIKVLWQHEQNAPIGKVLELREDSHGLFLKAQLSTTERALEAGQLLRDGIISEMSIGFNPVASHNALFGKEYVRYITEVELFEISLVTFAANRDALVSDVNGRTNFDAAMAFLDREAEQLYTSSVIILRSVELALLDEMERTLRG